MSATAYAEFLTRKAQIGGGEGFRPVFLPDFLFDFQAALVEWALSEGRAALLEDCGLGKSPQEMVWGENMVRHCNKPVLILTPLAVAQQFVREGEKFDLGVTYARRQAEVKGAGLYVTNYEKLHHFEPDRFAAVVCDESSILKHFGGTRQRAITEFLRRIRYRLLATATAAPNDYTELGTSSEALGHLGHMDMLGRFFKNDQNNASTGRGYLGKKNQWRFKGHAEEPFWRWVASWARALRRPSDLGFEDRGFRLSDLVEREHIVEARTLPEGWLLPVAAVRRSRWVPCFNSHPATNRACQLRGGHAGPHRCGYPGGVDRWTGQGWVRGMEGAQRNGLGNPGRAGKGLAEPVAAAHPARGGDE